MTTNYGTRFNPQLMAGFAQLRGGQFWNPTMICWGLGAFGLALTGVLESNTQEDMGAHVVTIDARHTEAAAKSDEVFQLRPGAEAALALALTHVMCGERLHDAAFVAQHTVGFGALAQHVNAYTPAWAEGITGIAAPRIVELARRHGSTRAAMIALGGSSTHKGGNGWQASRAIACLPALTGNLGVAVGGFGPCHGRAAHGRGLGNVAAAEGLARTGLADGAEIRVLNQRGQLRARAQVTERIPPGTLWLRDGWPGLNEPTAAVPVLPDKAVDVFAFAAGQASFDARVQAAPFAPNMAG